MVLPFQDSVINLNPTLSLPISSDEISLYKPSQYIRVQKPARRRFKPVLFELIDSSDEKLEDEIYLLPPRMRHLQNSEFYRPMDIAHYDHSSSDALNANNRAQSLVQDIQNLIRKYRLDLYDQSRVTPMLEPQDFVRYAYMIPMIHIDNHISNIFIGNTTNVLHSTASVYSQELGRALSDISNTIQRELLPKIYEKPLNKPLYFEPENHLIEDQVISSDLNLVLTTSDTLSSIENNTPNPNPKYTVDKPLVIRPHNQPTNQFGVDEVKIDNDTQLFIHNINSIQDETLKPIFAPIISETEEINVIEFDPVIYRKPSNKTDFDAGHPSMAGSKNESDKNYQYTSLISKKPTTEIIKPEQISDINHSDQSQFGQVVPEKPLGLMQDLLDHVDHFSEKQDENNDLLIDEQNTFEETSVQIPEQRIVEDHISYQSNLDKVFHRVSDLASERTFFNQSLSQKEYTNEKPLTHSNKYIKYKNIPEISETLYINEKYSDSNLGVLTTTKNINLEILVTEYADKNKSNQSKTDKPYDKAIDSISDESISDELFDITLDLAPRLNQSSVKLSKQSSESVFYKVTSERVEYEQKEKSINNVSNKSEIEPINLVQNIEIKNGMAYNKTNKKNSDYEISVIKTPVQSISDKQIKSKLHLTTEHFMSLSLPDKEYNESIKLINQGSESVSKNYNTVISTKTKEIKKPKIVIENNFNQSTENDLINESDELISNEMFDTQVPGRRFLEQSSEEEEFNSKQIENNILNQIKETTYYQNTIERPENDSLNIIDNKEEYEPMKTQQIETGTGNNTINLVMSYE